jgi:RPA family protein
LLLGKMEEKDNNQKNVQKRQVAYKIMIKDINASNYIKEEGWNPNYLILSDGKKINRVNVFGIIIDKPTNENLSTNSLTIDDGSGSIVLRTFDENENINDFDIGTPVLVIGKPREFNNVKYIVPEIIKKIDDVRWIQLRKKELNLKSGKEGQKVEVHMVEEEVVDDGKGIDAISLVKGLDKGNGADITEVIEKLKKADAETIINNMIKVGELFEISPGKIKVLE